MKTPSQAPSSNLRVLTLGRKCPQTIAIAVWQRMQSTCFPRHVTEL